MRTTKRTNNQAATAKPVAVQIRGTLAWKQWLADLANMEGDTVSQFLARLAHQYAHRHGYPQPPRR